MRSVFFLVCVLLVNIDAARILAYLPGPSISHQLPFRPLTQELARRGHEVVVITTDPAFPKGETPANLTEIDIHDISYDSIKEFVMNQRIGSSDDFISQMVDVFSLFVTVIDNQLKYPEVRDLLNSEQKFDLLILEAFSRAALSLSCRFEAPVVLVSSFGPYIGTREIVGIPSHPILYPLWLRQRLYNLTFWEKLKELYNHYKVAHISHSYEKVEHKMLQNHFGEDLPPLSELYNNVDMLFLNIHPIFEGNVPVPPSVVYMWGIHKKPQNELPEALKRLLDSSKNGVIYMSFGTNTDPSKLTPTTIEKFVKVFCELPYKVLWKWNDDDVPKHCTNIRFEKWFPQSDLLRHPNVKLFITQGGLQSTDEAIAAGVPLIGIPIMGDQWFNVEKYVKFKIGIHLDVMKFTKDDFKDAVTTVINDEKYRENIQKLEKLMRDDPMPALERAVWWTEYVLRHGGARHLRAPAANVSWAQYLELELVATILIGFILIILLCTILLIIAIRFIRVHYFRPAKLKKKE